MCDKVLLLDMEYKLKKAIMRLNGLLDKALSQADMIATSQLEAALVLKNIELRELEELEED